MNSTYNKWSNRDGAKSSIFYANAGSRIYRNDEGSCIFRNDDGSYIYKPIAKWGQPNKQGQPIAKCGHQKFNKWQIPVAPPTNMKGTCENYLTQITNLMKKGITYYYWSKCLLAYCLVDGAYVTTNAIINFTQKIVEYVKTTSSNVFNTYWKAANGMDIRRNAV